MTSQLSDSTPIVLPNLHDGNLLGLMSVDEQCILLVSDVLGSMHRITLHAVESLRAENFLQGNIVLDVSVQTRAEVTEPDVLFALSMDEATASQHRRFLDELLGRIGNGSLHLFQLSSSYGCTLTSLCGDVASQLVDRDTLLRELGL